MPQIREQIAMVHLPPSKTLKYLFHVRKTKKRCTLKGCISFLVSLSKNYANAPVSAIIEETGVFSWKAGEKMHGMSQSS